MARPWIMMNFWGGTPATIHPPPRPGEPAAMPTDARAAHDPGPLWADGEFWLQVRGGGGDRLYHIPRPYGVIGRLDGADIQIDDRGVSARHIYFHLDERGLYAVDLASRTGTRFPGTARHCGWIEPGESIEVAGRRIQFVEARFRDREGIATPDPDAGRDDLLAAADDRALARILLYPTPNRESPRSLDSELVFAGRGASCGIRVEGASASRIHAALVRTRTGAFVVDLLGRGTWRNDQAVLGAAPLLDDDSLGLGTARFRVRIEPPIPLGATDIHRAAGDPVGTALAMNHPEPAVPSEFLSPQEGQSAQLAAMVVQMVHAGQAEALRRQDEFHMALLRMVHQIQSDNAAMLSDHLERMESINEELGTLRDELRRRLGPEAAAVPPMPDLPPLRIAAMADAAPPQMATDWLLERVSQLEQESQSTWKNILGRLAGQKGPAG